MNRGALLIGMIVANTLALLFYKLLEDLATWRRNRRAGGVSDA